jgi:hypothetical protein
MAEAEFDFYVHCEKHVASPLREAVFPRFFGRKVPGVLRQADMRYFFVHFITDVRTNRSLPPWVCVTEQQDVVQPHEHIAPSSASLA